MKTFILVLILALWFFYYFVPYETKVLVIEKVWIDSSFLKPDKVDVKVKWEVVKLLFDKNRKASFSWNISDWLVMPDLSWASKSYVKCFYEKDYINFNWNVVLHKIYLSKNKTIVVKLIKDKPESNLSIYVYKTVSIMMYILH